MEKLRLILAVVFCAFSWVIVAQSETNPEEKTSDSDNRDTSRMIVINDSNTCDYDDNNSLRFGMLDLGISTYLSNGSLNLPEQYQFMDQRLINSVNIGVHMINMRIDFTKDSKPAKVGIVTGLKINMSKYAFEDNFRLNPNQTNFVSSVEFVNEDLKKNRLFATYLALPLLVDFNLSPKNSHKSIKFSAGYVANILLGANHKIKGESIGKERVRNNFHLNKYLGMIEARVGLGPLNLYFQYGLNSLFNDDLGPDLRPISFGVNIIPR